MPDVNTRIFSSICHSKMAIYSFNLLDFHMWCSQMHLFFSPYGLKSRSWPLPTNICDEHFTFSLTYTHRVYSAITLSKQCRNLKKLWRDPGQTAATTASPWARVHQADNCSRMSLHKAMAQGTTHPTLQAAWVTAWAGAQSPLSRRKNLANTETAV